MVPLFLQGWNLAYLAMNPKNIYASVLLHERRTLTEGSVSTFLYLGSHGSATGWHLDYFYLPAINFHWGGAVAVW